jgi:hypothetical protein
MIAEDWDCVVRQRVLPSVPQKQPDSANALTHYRGQAIAGYGNFVLLHTGRHDSIAQHSTQQRSTPTRQQLQDASWTLRN